MKTVMFASCLCLLSTSLFAQQNDIPKNLADSVGFSLSYAEGEFLESAQAMPEAKYSFVPTNGNFKDARTFAEQVKHVACSNYGFFNEIEGKTPPEHCEKGGPVKAVSKAELLKYLRDSFDYGNKVLATINEKNALDRVDGPYAGPNTRVGMAITAVWHISVHYGQIAEYLRMNGIIPPSTQKYPLKVR
ncbi:MAG TPA: DinB family protein [Terriglobales bacterium]|nr:DinB family protein [Terriglobales bacterium]